MEGQIQIAIWGPNLQQRTQVGVLLEELRLYYIVFDSALFIKNEKSIHLMYRDEVKSELSFSCLPTLTPLVCSLDGLKPFFSPDLRLPVSGTPWEIPSFLPPPFVYSHLESSHTIQNGVRQKRYKRTPIRAAWAEIMHFPWFTQIQIWPLWPNLRSSLNQ